jgi:hypothetical protein
MPLDTWSAKHSERSDGTRVGHMRADLASPPRALHAAPAPTPIRDDGDRGPAVDASSSLSTSSDKAKSLQSRTARARVFVAGIPASL